MSQDRQRVGRIAFFEKLQILYFLKNQGLKSAPMPSLLTGTLDVDLKSRYKIKTFFLRMRKLPYI